MIFLTASPGCTTEMTITGKVAVAGHEPFTYTRVITNENIEYKLVGPKEELLRKKYQQQIVSLEGRVVKKAIGPEFPAEFAVEKISDKE